MSHDPACTLTARDYKGPLPEADMSTVIAHSLRADGFDASEDGTGRGTPIVVTLDSTPLVDESGVSPSLKVGTGLDIGQPPCIAIQERAVCENPDAGPDGAGIRTDGAMGHDGSHANGGGQVAVAFHENQRAELVENDTAGALKVQGGKPGQGYPAVREGMAVRRLTPRECERLQGFPDDYTDIPWRGKKHAPDGPRYKALGNSMAVNVMSWIGQRIALLEDVLAQRREVA